MTGGYPQAFILYQSKPQSIPFHKYVQKQPTAFSKGRLLRLLRHFSQSFYNSRTLPPLNRYKVRELLPPPTFSDHPLLNRYKVYTHLILYAQIHEVSEEFLQQSLLLGVVSPVQQVGQVQGGNPCLSVIFVQAGSVLILQLRSVTFNLKEFKSFIYMQSKPYYCCIKGNLRF